MSLPLRRRVQSLVDHSLPLLTSLVESIQSSEDVVGPLLSFVALALSFLLVLLALTSLLSSTFSLVLILVAHLALGLLGMDGLTWLVVSWAFVGGLCYLALTRLGNAQGVQQSTGSTTSASNSNKTSTEWANEVVQWLFNNLQKVPEPLDAWIKSLNEAAKKVTSPAKCEILFEGFGDHSKISQPPKFSNIRVENGPRDHLTLRSDVHLPNTRLKLVSSQRTPERMIVSNFDAHIVDLRGEVEARLACIANQLYIMGCFNGRPEMEIELTNTDPNYQVEVNRSLVEDGVRRCLLSAVTNVNLSETSLPYTDRSSMPRMSPMFGNTSASTYVQASPNAYDRDPRDTLTSNHVYANNASSPNRNSEPVAELFKKLSEPSSKLLNDQAKSVVPNKLRVTVLKGQKLGRSKQPASEPYVVIEMDEPAQKHSTTKSLQANPYWEETFDFDLTPASEEILFEVYDAKTSQQDKGFLGLAIVNFEEIRRSGEMMNILLERNVVSQTVHILPLQGRPYRSDPVDGNITCKFDFYYDPNNVHAGKKVDTVTIKRNDGSEFRETVSTQRRPIYDPYDNFEEPVATKTTTISVKAVERQPPKEKNFSKDRSIDKPPESPAYTDSTFRENMFDTEIKRPLPTTTSNRMSGTSEPESSRHIHTTEYAENDDRGRGRDKANGAAKRDRSFFRDLKERLSGRGKKSNRARSVDVADDLDEAVSLPPSRDHSQTRWAGADGKNRRYFETTSVGGRSGESTKSLYQHSTLLLEINEGQEKKYFLIPPNLLNEPEAVRLLRKGKKLHIYNEHTFVAVKIKGGALCNVCQGRIGRSFSKQAYQCRDCKMVCHKSCHYKTDTFCTESSVSRLHIAKDVDWTQYVIREPMHEFISYPGV